MNSIRLAGWSCSYTKCSTIVWKTLSLCTYVYEYIHRYQCNVPSTSSNLVPEPTTFPLSRHYLLAKVMIRQRYPSPPHSHQHPPWVMGTIQIDPPARDLKYDTDDISRMDYEGVSLLIEVGDSLMGKIGRV